MKVLWLTSWFPGRVDSLSGDFVERHARNAALFDEVVVVHVTKDPALSGDYVFEERRYAENLLAFIYYYPASRIKTKWLATLYSNIYFLRLHLKAYRLYKKKFGKPAGILVQVGIKAGFVALWLKKFKRIPFILFERWTGFLDEARPGFGSQPSLNRKLWKSCYRNATKLVTVSDYFGKTILGRFGKKDWAVIPNAVDSKLFFPAAIPSDPGAIFRLIHVSNMDYQKNFEAILQALHLIVRDLSFEMNVYGPVSQAIRLRTQQLELESRVTYHGEVPHAEIAKAMQSAHALILFSRYETFGSVIIEANACGKPVITSDHPVFKEVVEEGITGILAKNEDSADLAEKIKWMKENYELFEPEKIVESVKRRFHPIVIGKMFNKLFEIEFGANRR